MHRYATPLQRPKVDQIENQFPHNSTNPTNVVLCLYIYSVSAHTKHSIRHKIFILRKNPQTQIFAFYMPREQQFFFIFIMPLLRCTLKMRLSFARMRFMAVFNNQRHYTTLENRKNLQW